jgi:hypothetical protein
MRKGLRGFALYLYVGSLVLAGALLMLGLLIAGAEFGNPWFVLALCITAAVGERWNVPLSATSWLSVYLIPTTFAAVVVGPMPAAAVGSAAMLGDAELHQRLRHGTLPTLRWVTYTSSGLLTGALAGIAARLLEDAVSSPIGAVTLMTFAALIVAEGIDLAIAALTSMARGRTAADTLRSGGSVMLTSFLVYAPVVALLVAAYTQVSAWTMPLFLVPALALQRVYILYQHQRQLTEQLTHANTQLSDANRTLENANLSFATALVQTLEESDRYTAGHSRAVANYARDIGVRLRLSRSDCDRLYLCGLVHDMGKIGLPPSLLNKEGRLTLEERREMEKHSEIGERILAKVEAYADVARIVRHHHERFDGQGYPDGIQGNDVPLESRIIAVADAYNAMTSDRPYRKAMDYEIARDRLLQAMGSQFFTEPVVAFLSELADADDDYRYARGSDFGPVEPGAAFSVLIRGASLTDSPAADAA